VLWRFPFSDLWSFFFYKNHGSGSVFIGPDFNHVQGRERTIIGSVSYRNRYWLYRIESYRLLLYRGKPTLRASRQIPQLISDNRLHYTGWSKDIRAPSLPHAHTARQGRRLERREAEGECDMTPASPWHQDHPVLGLSHQRQMTLGHQQEVIWKINCQSL